MKFKEWLKINEDAGRSRAKQADLQNVRIGKLGPYGTFGHTDVPNPFSQLASGYFGALGQALSDKVGRVEPLSRVINPFGDFENHKQSADTLILQLPFIEGKQLGYRINPNNPKMTFDNVYALLNQVGFDRIRISPNDEGAFDLFTYEMENKEDDQIKYTKKEYAQAFTTALSKIRLREQFIEQYPKIDEKFDFKNPQVFQKIIDYQGYPYLQSVFQYKTLKTSMDDEKQYKTAWEN